MIYFIKCGEFVKIGVTVNMQNRLSGIQTDNPYPVEVLATVPGGYELETRLHQLCAEDRHSREWFNYTDRVRGVMNWATHNTEDENMAPSEDWRFEVKRKPRKAKRKNTGSTAGKKWYYWVVRVNGRGQRVYYGTLADVPWLTYRAGRLS